MEAHEFASGMVTTIWEAPNPRTRRRLADSWWFKHSTELRAAVSHSGVP